MPIIAMSKYHQVGASCGDLPFFYPSALRQQLHIQSNTRLATDGRSSDCGPLSLPRIFVWTQLPGFHLTTGLSPSCWTFTQHWVFTHLAPSLSCDYLMFLSTLAVLQVLSHRFSLGRAGHRCSRSSKYMLTSCLGSTTSCNAGVSGIRLTLLKWIGC